MECWYWGEPFRPNLTSAYDFGSGEEGVEEAYDGWGEPSVDAPEGGFVAVDAGREAACGIRPSGLLECWGANPLASVPPPGGVFFSVSVGIDHACALRPGGQAECWGTSARIAGAVFPPGGEFTSIAAGVEFVCGLRPSGEVECWGRDYRGSGGLGDWLTPSGFFKAVSAGGWGDVCGLRLDNSVECWGNYEPTREANRESTYLLPPGGEFESLTLGEEDYACGLRPGGEAECWSKVTKGEAGEANGPPEGEKFTQVEVGWGDACGVRADNTLLCWNRHSEIDDRVIDRVIAFHEKFHMLDNVRQLEIGRGDACALFVDRTVQCFFDLLQETESLSGVFSSVSVSSDHACGLRPTGAVECWGSDEHGKASPPKGEFTELAASADFTCGLRVSGEVECWGGSREGRHSKVVAPRERLVFIDAGWGGHNDLWPFEKLDGFGLEVLPSPSSVDWGYSCGLREDGSLLCWGNRDGRSVEHDDWPLLSPPEGVFVDVGVGRYQACALSITKEVKCWGSRGEDGEYTYGEKTGQRFDSLEVGGWHACGLHSDGRVECWNLSNQFRVLPAPTDRNGGERRYSYISAGYFHVCGVRTGIDAGVDCWGPTTTRYGVGGRPRTDDDVGVM